MVPRRIWHEHASFKAASLDRTKSPTFRDGQYIARFAMRMFEDEWILDYLANVVRTKKKNKKLSTFDLRQLLTVSCIGFRAPARPPTCPPSWA